MKEESNAKQPISTKVPAKVKTRLVEQAKQEGLTTSEFVAQILATDFEQQEKEHQQQVEELKGQIIEKDNQLQKLAERLEKEQNLLSQQQQLQLLAQQQLVELQKNQQLLIETSSRKWWQRKNKG